MLLLNRARLINWHFFTDDTIEFGPMSLLAGDNGSGKSTIIDALQYALVLNISKVRFNAAAADSRTSRNLAGYCRCKIGSDTLAYLRDSCVTHIILEFGDGEKHFCSGVMVEAYADSETKEHQWIMEDGVLEDIKVFYNNEFLPAGPFKDTIKAAGGTVCSTKREYNSRLTHLLKVHRRNVHFNPYLEALVRSVNFTPFTSVHDFVCTYILEERQVDISAMKENLINYKEAEREAIEMEKKIFDLEEIDTLRTECDDLTRQIIFQEYLIRRIDVEKSTDRIKAIEKEISQCARDKALLEEEIRGLQDRKDHLEEMRSELSFSLATNEQYRLYERINNEIEQKKTALGRETEREKQLSDNIARCRAILGRPIAEDIKEETQTVQGKLEEVISKNTEYGLELDKAKSLLRELQEEQRDLKKGILRYPSSTLALKKVLEAEGISAAVFADQLEVIDGEWQNAVEGWLNTQRFNILVPEQEFQRALSIYDKQPKDVAGVGLPDIARMRKSEVSHGSLAEVVEASSVLARRYAAYLLGDVVRTELPTLNTYEKAITKECMRYASRTASRIKEEIYSKWYIGKAAVERRLEELEEEINSTVRNIEKYIQEIKKGNEEAAALRGVNEILFECIHLADAPRKGKELKEAITELEERLAGIDRGSFKEIQLQIGGILESLKKIEEDLSENNRRLGAMQNREEELLVRREHTLAEKTRFMTVLEGFLSDHQEYSEEFEEYYKERMKGQKQPPDYEGIQQRYGPAIKGIRTRLERQKDRLVEFKNRFNNSYHVYLAVDYFSDEFSRVLKEYRETALPEYKEKIRRAREEAEKQFREHFVSRLNEYITDARESFKEINYTLSTIRFGQDQYRFGLEERPEKREVLRVISAAAEIREWEGTLFDQFTSEDQRESIEKLFESILDNPLDSEELKEICDYREYFQYDIRIKHTDTLDKMGRPLESSLTKVLREKSGGETQTPYYVAIAASFFRFYKDEQGAIRLVLFDEAFNKMDDERIGKMIDFFKKLNMQIITAVPTEKIESIAPHMDVTNLVLRKDYSAFVRRYSVRQEAELQ